jgi:hypothetical protein
LSAYLGRNDSRTRSKNDGCITKHMIKIGNMKPLTGTDGEIIMNCRKDYGF